MKPSGPKPNALFLVGFMGAGKTSVGRLLSERLGWRFVDLDDVVEARAGRSIADIFAESGEAGFREAESAALREVLLGLRTAALVVALGGGTFVQPQNADAIRQSGAPVVFLDAPVEELRRRCGPKAGKRPLFQDENQFRQLCAARQSGYMQADMRVETAGRTISETAAEVASRLGLDQR